MSMPEAFHISEEELIQYAMGTLKDTQLSTMTAHISLCNQCRDALAKLQVELACFASIQPLSELPAGAKDRFMARLNPATAEASNLVKMRDRNRLYVVGKQFKNWLETPMPLKILSGALAAALLLVAYDDIGHIHEIRQLLPAMKRFEAQTAALSELQTFLEGSHAQQVSLHEKPALNKAPEGHVLYAANTGKLVFTASNMAAPPQGKAYELWILPLKGNPVPAGVFTPDLQGSAAVILPEIPKNVQASGFGVTVEDAQGATTPTMPIVISGQ